jgi:hypothetical protein
MKNKQKKANHQIIIKFKRKKKRPKSSIKIKFKGQEINTTNQISPKKRNQNKHINKHTNKQVNIPLSRGKITSRTTPVHKSFVLAKTLIVSHTNFCLVFKEAYKAS